MAKKRISTKVFNVSNTRRIIVAETNSFVEKMLARVKRKPITEMDDKNVN